MGEAEVTKLDISEIERTARKLARNRANTEMWSADIALYIFAVLVIIVILLFEGVRNEISVLIAIFGLGMGWLVGFRQGKRLYQRFYDEELVRLGGGFRETDTETAKETVEEMVRKALTDRWRGDVN